MALVHFNKELRKLWKKVRGKHAPHPKMAEDIEELLNAEEWGLALEHILDWAAHEKKLQLIEIEAKGLKEAMRVLEHFPTKSDREML